MQANWSELERAVLSCGKCRLCVTRTHTVLGEGSSRSGIMFVGEGPGREEDETGRPFVGAAGRLLDKMLSAIDLRREDVYIANIVKCRPPGNRVPQPEEASACLPYLRQQFVLVQPKILVCLGSTAARWICGSEVRITRDRGIWRQQKGVWILPTYHPAALLRDPAKKRQAWEDMQSLRDKWRELSGDNVTDKNGQSARKIQV